MFRTAALLLTAVVAGLIGGLIGAIIAIVIVIVIRRFQASREE